ncbi:MAG: hypothetical protein M3Y87_18320 [Myxococcota bacterium]|nr:hypothetical protein [Myxococcota bacterium]
MARTTLAIDDQILRQLKARALAEGKTVQAVTNELLRTALTAKRREPFRLVLSGWDGVERAGVTITDRNALYDLLDG